MVAASSCVIVGAIASIADPKMCLGSRAPYIQSQVSEDSYQMKLQTRRGQLHAKTVAAEFLPGQKKKSKD